MKFGLTTLTIMTGMSNDMKQIENNQTEINIMKKQQYSEGKPSTVRENL